MIDIAQEATKYAPPESLSLPRKRELPWNKIALGAILLLSIFMNFFQLGQNGYGNLFYAAGVRSMGDSWHNFFFVSFDPGGFVTLDKPELGFWLQTLSTKIFGFTAFSIFFPQALCGVLAVWLLYALVRRHFGTAAGLIAALALAVSPISVVTNRNNTIDGTLALALLLAAWAVIHASETGKLRWLLLSGVFLGLGFNIKMAEAYLVVPALVMTYLLCAPRKIWTRILHIVLFALVGLTISLPWMVMVDLTPASQRPYVGSTQDNSELNLAIGYNGLNRLNRNGPFGGNRGGNRNRRPANGNQATNSGSSSAADQSRNAPFAANGGPQTRQSQGNTNGNAANFAQQFQNGGPFAGNAANPLHLFTPSFGGQIAWLLPFALLTIIALAWQKRSAFGQMKGSSSGAKKAKELSLLKGSSVGATDAIESGPYKAINHGIQFVFCILRVFQGDRQLLGLVLWGFWLVTMTVFFTIYGALHEYYMAEMAPGLCAMVGIGFVIMGQQYRSGNWRGWLLPIALAVTAGAQIYILSSFPAWSLWLSLAIGLPTALVVIALILFRLQPKLLSSTLRIGNSSEDRSQHEMPSFTESTSGDSLVRTRAGARPQGLGSCGISRIFALVLGIGLLALLIAPTTWATYSVIQNTESSSPTAGPPAPGGDFGGFGNFSGGQRGNRAGAQNGLANLARAFGNENAQADPRLISYLKAHQGKSKFLVAVPSSMTADSIILSTNKPVMALGGFSGGDPILTLSQLQALIKNGTVRFFLINSPRATEDLVNQLPEQFRNMFTGGRGGGFGGFGGSNSTLTTWVSSHCSTVPPNLWQSATSNPRNSGGFDDRGGANQLYDCAITH